MKVSSLNENPQKELKAVVLGSTGAIGKVLVRQLCESDRWVEVSVIVRRRLDEWKSIKGFEKLKIIEVGSLDELQEAQKWNQFANYNTFFCTLGSRTKEGKDKFYKVDYTYCLWGAQIAQHNKIPHYSLLSSTGANANSMFLYMKTKGQIEQAIRELKFEYYSVFQPGKLNKGRTQCFEIFFLISKGFLKNRENDSRCGEKFAQYCCCCCIPGIEGEDCAKAMQLEAERRFVNNSNQSNKDKDLTYSNGQMNNIARQS